MGPLERMRDELGRARRRNSRVLLPEEAGSPMDRNPTVEVRADLIAGCLDEVNAHRWPDADPVVDQGMLDAAAGVAVENPARRRDLA